MHARIRTGGVAVAVQSGPVVAQTLELHTVVLDACPHGGEEVVGQIGACRDAQAARAMHPVGEHLQRRHLQPRHLGDTQSPMRATVIDQSDPLADDRFQFVEEKERLFLDIQAAAVHVGALVAG